MARMAREMTIFFQLHKVKESSTGEIKEVPVPLDLEGHQGTDGRYYVVDFARLLPPESPVKGYKYHTVALFNNKLAELVDIFTGCYVLSLFDSTRIRSLLTVLVPLV